MSSKSTVEISRRSDGRYRAVDSETGSMGEGETRIDALGELVARLERESGARTENPAVAFRDVSARAQRRFQEQGLEQEAIEDAIEWARSE